MRKIYFLPILALSAVLAYGCTHAREEICDGTLYSEGKDTFDLKANEKALVCRDSKNTSWEDIPLSQQEFHVREFLKERGYYSPMLRVHGKALIVDRGEPLLVRKFLVEGVPHDFDFTRIRGVIGQPLTRELLDRMEGTVLGWMKARGYACASVKLKAFEKEALLVAKVTSGSVYIFPEITLEDDAGFYPQTLRRFDAFSPGQLYDQRLLQLTSGRMESDGIVVNSLFRTECTKRPFGVFHKATAGESRMVSIGFGANTEEYPIAQATWRNLRLGKAGSSVTVSIYGSQRRQNLKGNIEWYFKPEWERIFLGPELSFEHLDENKFETAQAQFFLPLGTKLDTEENSFSLQAGPALVKLWTIEEPRRNMLQYFSIDTNLSFKTHNFELYQGDPRMGSEIQFSSRSMVVAGPDDEKSQEVGLRKRIGRRWVLSTVFHTESDGTDTQKALIEWFNRY